MHQPDCGPCSAGHKHAVKKAARGLALVLWQLSCGWPPEAYYFRALVRDALLLCPALRAPV